MFCQLFSLQNKSFLCLQHVENKGFQTVIKHRLKAIQKPIKNELGNREKNTKNAHFVLKKCTFRFRDYTFNLKKYAEYGGFETDPRWQGYGVPPTSNANYAWILHILNKLNVSRGIAGFLLANGALDDSDTQEIRKQLIESDKVEAIIVLPRNMFYSTDISVTLWILNNNKKGGPWHGRQLRNRTGEILFIDLRTWNSNIYEKKYVRLAEADIDRVRQIYFNWQTENFAEYAEPELYYAAHRDEIQEKGYSLVPSRYIEFVDRDTEIDYQSALSEMSHKFDALKKRWDANETELVNAFKILGYGKE